MLLLSPVLHISFPLRKTRLIFFNLLLVSPRSSFGFPYIRYLPIRARRCNFGQALTEMLRDRLVCGVNDERIQKRLLLKAKLVIKDGIVPKFCKARPVPYALKGQVEEELDRLTREGILEPVEIAEWAAPIVPVVKTDKKIRICGDFRLTINPALEVDRYPIPKIEDLLATLAGWKIFSKLDLSSGVTTR